MDVLRRKLKMGTASTSLPIFAYLGWECLRRVGRPVIGRNSKDYSACLLIFRDGPERRIYAEHQVELLEMLVRELEGIAPGITADFTHWHDEEVMVRAGRVRAFGRDPDALGDGAKYRIGLPSVQYYFVEAQTQRLTESLLSFTGCKTMGISAYKGMDPDALSHEAQAYIEAHSI